LQRSTEIVVFNEITQNKIVIFAGLSSTEKMSCRNLFYRSFSLLKYLLFSRHGSGHGIHSPYLYTFITEGIKARQISEEVGRIEEIRKTLLQSKEFIMMDDLGAGVHDAEKQRKSISGIVRQASIRKKYGRLLYQITKHIKPAKILELGTSLGFGSMYIAMANQHSEMVTLEGSRACSEVAGENFKTLGVNRIKLVNGSFRNTLPQVLKEMKWVDLVYFDGDHHKTNLLHYIDTALPFIRNDTIFIIDDIHWSKGMEEAWNSIKKYPRVKVTLDIFQMGIVIFRKELQKQDFMVRFL